MSADFSIELQQFHHFIGERIAAGNDRLSPEEALDEWRFVHPSAEAFEQDVTALAEALSDMAAGDKGLPRDEFDRQFRQRHRLPSNS